MRSLRDRLRDYHQQKTLPAHSAEPVAQSNQYLAGFSWRENEQGRYLARQWEFSLDYGAGVYKLKDLSANQHLTFLELLTKKRLNSINIEKLLFFDTETTGLGTGAGTTIFLFGLGYFRENQFIVEQFFLPDLTNEEALLWDFMDRLNQFEVLVSYNGKSYDWNLVQTRYSLYRLPFPDHMIHADLLYPARRLWKRYLPSCRLQEVEVSCLQIHRQEDTPGYLAPELYFQYLREQNLSLMEGIFKHNRLDIFSLVHLLTLLLERLAGTERVVEPLEKLALGKWLMELGEEEKAINWLIEVLNQNHPSVSRNIRVEAYQVLTEKWKREKDWNQAIPLWEQWMKEESWALTPYVELAKYYEHQCHDFERALSYTQQAIDVLLNQKKLHRTSIIGSQMVELRHRAKRLIEKQKKKAPCLEL